MDWTTGIFSLCISSPSCSFYYLPPSQKSCTPLRRLVCPVLLVIWWTYPEYQLDLLETWVPTVACSVTLLDSISTKSMNLPLVHLVRFKIPWFTIGRWWNMQFQIHVYHNNPRKVSPNKISQVSQWNPRKSEHKKGNTSKIFT